MLYQEGLKTLKKGMEKGISKKDFLKTGFKKFDKKYGGIYKKGITVIAGSYQDDLTNLGVSLLKNISIDNEISSYYISFHDIEIDIIKKVTSAFLQIKMKKIISGKLKKKDWSKIDKMIKADTILPTHIINNNKQDTIELTYMIRNLIFDKHPNLFIMDGINDMEGTRNEKLKLIEALRSISYNTGVPFILLHELGDSEKLHKGNGSLLKPGLSSDKYLKTMSDCIIYLADPVYENIKGKEGKKIKGESALIIRKSKYGKVGTINLKYRNNYCLFTDIDQ